MPFQTNYIGKKTCQPIICKSVICMQNWALGKFK